MLKQLIDFFTYLSTEEPTYNDIDLYETSPRASDILWYQLIRHCLPKYYINRL
jgi:hypothetical protein